MGVFAPKSSPKPLKSNLGISSAQPSAHFLARSLKILALTA
jgi:hypothetical protein